MRAVDPRNRSEPFALVMLAALVACLCWGCEPRQLSDSEQETVQQIFRSGLEMRADPFVRAETVRVMSLTGDPQLAAHVEPLVHDPHRMVRVGALKLLVKADHPRARQRALLLYNRADEQERLEIFEVSIAQGDPALRTALIDRGLRDEASSLRRRALQEGLLAQIDQAIDSGDDQTLEQELLPELDAFIGDDDPQISADALRILTQAGRLDRAQELTQVLGDSAQPVDDRIAAGRALMLANISLAEETYKEILDRVGAYDPDSLGIPERRIDDRLLRIAVLGMTNLGHEDFVDPAMRYLDDASPVEINEVLSVLANNPATDASIALRTHLRDANALVRRHALQLYGAHDDRRADALVGAMRPGDYAFQKELVQILAEAFPERWIQYVTHRLDDEDPARVEQHLRFLQSVLRSDEEIATLAPIEERLKTLAMRDGVVAAAMAGDEEEQALALSISSVAAYLLFRVSDDDAFQEVFQQNRDPQSRYAYLEHLVIHEPQDHVSTFREFLFDDYFALRLMAAAGLWTAYKDNLTWPVAQTDQESLED